MAFIQQTHSMKRFDENASSLHFEFDSYSCPSQFTLFGTNIKQNNR